MKVNSGRLSDRTIKRSPAPTTTSRRDYSKKHSGSIYKYKFSFDYWWNRGGRLKELRRRFLARKYVALWKKRTFGRVLPSQANRIIEKQAVNKAFKTWKDLWWVNRQEWRLEVRADCHYRFKATLLCFKAWRQYHQNCQSMKDLTMRAKWLYSRQLLKNTIRTWQKNALKQKLLTALFDLMTSARNNRLLKKYFVTWKHNFVISADVSMLSLSAKQYSAYRLQRKFFFRWRKSLNEKFFTDFKIDVIITERMRKIARVFLRTLHLTSNAKRPVRRLKTRADKFRRLSLLLRHYYSWTSQHEMTLKHQSKQRAINASARRVQLRRHFLAWKKCLVFRHNRQVQTYEAEFLYERTLKQKTFSACRRFVELNFKLRQIKEVASEFAAAKLVQRTFRVWTEAVDARQEAKMAWLFEMADDFRVNKLVSTCFSAWTEYTSVCREKAIKNLVAVEAWSDRTQRMTFKRWRVAAMKKRSNTLALQLSKFVLLRRVFHTWKVALDALREERLLSHLAISFDEKRLKNTHFKAWIVAFQQVLICNEKYLIFSQRRRFAVIQRSFSTWKKLYLDRADMHRDNLAAEQYQAYSSRRRCFNAWKQFVELKKDEKVQMEWAEEYYNTRLQQHFFDGLTKAIGQSRQAVEMAEARGAERDRLAVSTAFAVWRRQAIIFGAKKLKADLAHAAANRRLLHRCFVAWRLRASVTSAKHEWQDHKLSQFSLIKRKILLSKALQRWREHSDALIMSQLNFERATIFEERTLLKRTFEGWRRYRMECYRRAILNQWAQQFCSVRITARAFVRWRTALAGVRTEQHKSLVALWQWAFALKGAVFSAWMKFTLLKRQKRHRELEALQLRDELLRRRAVAHWLAVADQFWVRQRREWPPGEENTLSRRKFRLAQRFSTLWRENVERRKNARKSRRQPDEEKIVKENKIEQRPRSEQARLKTDWIPSKNRPMPRIPDFLLPEVERERLTLQGIRLAKAAISGSPSSSRHQKKPRKIAGNVNSSLEDISTLANTDFFSSKQTRSDSCSPKLLLLRPEDFSSKSESDNVRPLSACANSLITPDQLASKTSKSFVFRENSHQITPSSQNRQESTKRDEDSENLLLMELKHRLELVMTLKCELSNLKVEKLSLNEKCRLGLADYPENWQIDSMQQRMDKLQRDIDKETQLCRSLADECHIATND